MDTPVPDLRAPSQAETKLLASALSLFSEKGYEGTSIREIIEGAGVTRPVLYYYFENKEDLFRRLVEMKFAEFTAEIKEVLNRLDSCRDRLKAVMGRAFLLAEDNPEAIRLILQVLFAAPLQGPPMDRNMLLHQRFRLLELIMADGLANGELSGGDAQSLALVFMGIMDMHVMAKSNRPQTRLTRELAEGLVELFLSGATYNENPPVSLVSPYAF
jgi:TetR/AcrR family transcriptional regulator